MDQLAIRMFHKEIARQCDYADEGFGLLQTSMEQMGLAVVSINAQPFMDPWFPLSAILGASANISKLFWGSSRDGKRRAKTDRADFRSHYAVDETSPVHDTQVRNGLEHIDDRIEKAVKADGAMAMRNISPVRALNIGPDPGLFLHFDQTANVVYFGIDQHVRLNELRHEITRLQAIAVHTSI